MEHFRKFVYIDPKKLTKNIPYNFKPFVKFFKDNKNKK